jgi:hypothetical protein
VTFHRLIPALPALAALMLGACDPLSDHDYRGEALFSLEGKIDNRRAATPGDVKLSLVWVTTSASVPNVAEELDIAPTFPATFRLDVFNTPPVGERYPGETWTRMTRGMFVAATSDAQFDGFLPGSPTLIENDGLLGVDPRHVLLYLPDGIAADSNVFLTLQGALAPGFHMFDEMCNSPARIAEITACLERYRAEGRPEERGEIIRACGSPHPAALWLQLSPMDLQTELTIELIDDLEHYQRDPSECV